MKKRLLLCLVFLLTIGPTLRGQDVRSELKREVDQVLPVVRQDLNNSKLDPAQKYALNIVLARELLAQKYYQEAREFYQNALKLAPKSGSAEALVNLTFIKKQLLAPGEKISDSELEATVRELKQMSAGQEIAQEFSELYLAPKKTPKQYDGFYGAYKNDTQVRALILERRYAEALSLMGVVKSERDITTKITYDLLTRLVTKTKRTPLCEEVRAKYPNSISYSMMICKMLMDKNQNKAISSQALTRLKAQIERESPDKAYLYQLAQELK